MKFDQVMPHSIDLVIPGFERSYPAGVMKCLSITGQPVPDWFHEFTERLLAAIGSRFLPVYRMADGEYEFCVGYRYRLRKPGEPFLRYLAARAWLLGQRALAWRPSVGINARPGTDMAWESGKYSPQELLGLRWRYAGAVRAIAEEGILAMVFSYRQNQFAQQYFVPMTHWLTSHHIELTPANYYPFYFVYALLNGPQRHRLYAGRRVLVVTSFDDQKRDAIARGLAAEQVSGVQFIAISRNRSMYDQIDLAQVREPVDLVLVGAGIGAANILPQLRPLNTLAIDAGFCIECLANPALKKRRTFCWPDAEREGNYEPI